MTTRTQLRTIFLSLLAACLALGVTAGAARAEFELPAFDVTEDGASYYPRAAVDSAGAAHFLWQRQSVGLQTRTRGADGVLGPVLAIAGGSTTDQQLAADTAGNVQFVWRGLSGADWIVRTRRLHQDGTLGPTVDLSSAGFDGWGPQLAFDAAGGIVFAWVRTLDTGTIVQARRMAPNGTLGPVYNISAAGDVGSARLAVDHEGNAAIAWYRNDGSFYLVQARRWAADGTLGPIVGLSDAGAHALDVEVGMDGDGIAHFAFVRGQAVKIRRMSVGGVLSPTQDMREGQTDVTYDMSLAVDEAGRAQVVWCAVSPVRGNVVQTRREHPDGSLGPVQTLGDYTPLVTQAPEVALDSDGTAHHVWMLEIDSDTVIVGRSALDDSLGAIQQLSAAGGDAANPDVATGPEARAVATWTRISDTYAELVQGAVLQPEPVAGAAPAGTTPAPDGGDSGSAPSAGADRLAPTLSGLAMKPARLAVRRRGRVRYALSEPSTVILQVIRRGAARRVVGRLRTTGAAGTNTLRFPRRLRGRYLRPGRYQLVAVGTDRAGNRSVPARARFRVTRR